ncbi:hypothetical protein LCGC14_2998330, partial [marine sediment metagenome]
PFNTGGTYYDGLVATPKVLPPSILDVLPEGAIYADAMPGVGGNTINKVTLSVDDYIVDPLVIGHATAWGDDGFWTLNPAPPEANGGIDAAGSVGGSSFYSYDIVNPAPVLTTTVTDMDPATNYDVFLAYYARDGGVQAAFEDQPLTTYTGFEIDTGIDAGGGAGSVKLKKLGEITGVSSLGVDIANSTTDSSWYEGVVVSPYFALPNVLDGFAEGSIYADAMYGPEGNTINSVTLSVDDYIVVSDVEALLWDPNDGKWALNPGWANGGLNEAGEINGTSFYENDGPGNSPVLTTTATGLDPEQLYDVYLAYYTQGDGVSAALLGGDLVDYFDNFDIDTGFGGTSQGDTVKLALLGQVGGVDSVSV